MKWLLTAALASMAFYQGAQAKTAPTCKPQWVAAWGSAQFQPDANNALPTGSFADKTLREIVRASIDGRRIRLRLSNLANAQPLTLKGVSVALARDPAHAAINPATVRPVRFDGRDDVTIPAGADYYHPDARNEADRQEVNAWIRGKGNFDGIIDFDAITRDPAHPERLLPAYDKGDHLHPGPAGYRAMGQAIALTLFK